MGGDGREPFPWMLLSIVIVCFCVGFLGGMWFSGLVLLP